MLCMFFSTPPFPGVNPWTTLEDNCGVVQGSAPVKKLKY